MTTRVAIIGSGVAGLAAASKLHEKGLDITIFEADSHIGGHAWTTEIDGVPVDLGFQVFNRVTYPNMVDWFERNGVEMEPSDMSFGISMNEGSLEWASHSLSAFYAQKSNILNPYFHKMLLDIWKFEHDVKRFLASGTKDTSMTLRQFVEKHGYGSYFMDYYLIPICASIWSSSPTKTKDASAMFILSFLYNHHMLQLTNRPMWCTVAGRSKNYVEIITAPFKDRIHLNSPVTAVVPTADGKVQVTVDNKLSHVFDKVIFACHAPQALEILGKAATEKQKSLLQTFKYQDNECVLHRDEKLMPKRKTVWSSWNFLGARGEDVCVTYYLNKLQNLGDTGKPILVTLNPIHKIDESLLVKRMIMAHPVPTVESYKAQAEMPSIQGINNIFFCGAYLGYGFHEDGVKAGFDAAHRVLKVDWSPLANVPQFRPTLFQGFTKTMVLSFLRNFITQGQLRIHENGGDVIIIGDKKPGEKPCTLIVRSPEFYTSVALRADLGVADAYIEGYFNVDLMEFLTLIIQNRDNSRRASGGKLQSMITSNIGATIAYFRHLERNNSVTQSRKNISDHYDLSNDLFGLFLDETMTYSCGIYRNPDDSLYRSQLNKLEALANKACLRPTDRVLEIGFGWGSLSILIAKRIGCRVTGITLSAEQKAYAEALVKREGLEHLIDYHLVDYRLFTPGRKFDRILSCEMLEAVGHEYLPDFFYHTDRLLKKDGIMVVQVITTPDERYDLYRTGADFIQEFIFPGACCPALSALLDAMKSKSSFMVEHIDNIGPHYARTLAEWRKNWHDKKEDIFALHSDFGHAFFRKWDYYFAYCQAGFQTRTLSDLQIVFTKPQNLSIPFYSGYIPYVKDAGKPPSIRDLLQLK